MKKNTHSKQTNMNRRRFVTGISAGVTAAVLGARIPMARATEGQHTRHRDMVAAVEQIRNGLHDQGSTGILTGTEFHLSIERTQVNITGKKAWATAINGKVPGPVLVWREGGEVTIHVTNNLDEDSSIHWHGIILPYDMDGVPGVSFPGIKPGETFTYRFTVQQSGTYWYHSHSGFQEQSGHYGSIVVLPKQPEPLEYDVDYVVQLSDWSDESPTRIYHKLKKQSDYYNITERTVFDFWKEVKAKGLKRAFNDRKMWNRMRMSDRDLSDVTGYTYTFLMNGASPAANFRVLYRPGQKVRLRIINSSAMTFFDFRIPGLKMTVVAADGQLVQPVTVDEFRIGVAETYDVIVEPEGPGPYPLFAQALDRSGYALGSLTTDATRLAVAPPMDPVPVLAHVDMGMDMDMSQMKMKGMDHGGMAGMMAGASGMSHAGMKSMAHGHMAQGTQSKKKNMSHHAMEHMAADDVVIPMDMEPNLPVTPLPKKRGPHTTMRAQSPQYRLDDPGPGLRDMWRMGRKVLTYADLKNRYPTAHWPKPTREIILRLTGNMERYMWSINGIPYAESDPLEFYYGERLRVTFINDTMMNHPMHLHGMWSDLETGDENHIPRKHTVIVQPGAKISMRVTVDAPGRWVFHCHLLYHMGGMFREVTVVETRAAEGEKS